MHIKKNLVIILLLVFYFIFIFRIEFKKNSDVYIRLIPVEAIRYFLVPYDLTKEYRKEAKNTTCKKLKFSKEYILYLNFSNDRLYEIVKENGAAINRLFIPKFEYEISDTFTLKIYGENYKYADMLYFSVIENNTNLFSGYIPVYSNGCFVISDYLKQKLTELLTQYSNSKFVITECVSIGENY